MMDMMHYRYLQTKDCTVRCNIHLIVIIIVTINYYRKHELLDGPN